MSEPSPALEREGGAALRPHPVRFDRRRFVALVAGGAAALVGGSTRPVLAQSAPLSATAREPVDAWAELRETVAAIQRQEVSPVNGAMLSDLRDSLERLGLAYAERAQKVRSAVALAEAEPRADRSLLVGCQKQLGALDIEPATVAPIFAERIALETGKTELEQRAIYLLQTHRTRADNDRLASFVELKEMIDRAADRLSRYAGVGVTGGCRGHEPEILMDPAITPTQDGNRTFEADERLLRAELDTFAAYQRVCSRYIISSDRYGPRATGGILQAALGAFQPFESEGSPYFYGLHSLGMDPMSETGRFGRRIVLFHEAFGHGTSVLVNPALESMLSPQQWVERATFEQEIMNNPDWAARDGSIPDLFRPYPPISNVEQYIADAPTVDPDTFSGLIRRYPMRRLLEPVFVNVSSTEEKLALRVDSLFDVAGATGKVSLKPVSQLERPEQVYELWGAFCQMYKSHLQGDALGGNVRARILLAGLAEYERELAYDHMLNDSIATGQDRTGGAWARRMNGTLANALVYHLFLNGGIKGVDYREYFSPTDRRELEMRVYEKRTLYRGELWADGIAYSHIFGDRIEDNPFRSSLRHIASMIN